MSTFYYLADTTPPPPFHDGDNIWGCNHPRHPCNQARAAPRAAHPAAPRDVPAAAPRDVPAAAPRDVPAAALSVAPLVVRKKLNSAKRKRTVDCVRIPKQMRLLGWKRKKVPPAAATAAAAPVPAATTASPAKRGKS